VGSIAAVALVVASALVVATCSHRDRPPPAAPSPLDTLASAAQTATTADSVAPPMPSAVSSEGASAEPTATPAQQAPPVEARGPGHELDRFYAALRSLERHQRTEHVRIAWLGDSHGAADLWTAPLREALQKRFGNAGPGFVHVGYKSYRHEGVHLEIHGKWATTPKGPSTGVKTKDGIFGLGGVLLWGNPGGPNAGFTLTDTTLPSALSWDLCWKPEARDDELRVSLTGQPDRTLRPDQGAREEALRHVLMTSSGASPKLRVHLVSGRPKLCGVTVETDPKTQPGVVLDTLGINGARLTTPLAWDEAAWVRELSRRSPSLVILEYGTNESGDFIIDPAQYVARMRRMMARIHKASPGADCVVLAPTDRADTLEKTPRVRDALRAAAKDSRCMFWDTYEAMGGKGSILAWRSATPPRAARDGVHLNARGYRELGEKLTADLMAGYRP
jgi:lysophospholipase L1-like esterase